MDLHGDFDLLLLSQLLVVARPRMSGESFRVAEALPEFFGQMGRERRQQQDKRFEVRRGDLFRAAEAVGERHQRRDRRVELQGFDVITDFLHRAVHQPLNPGLAPALSSDRRVGGDLGLQVPDAGEEAQRADQALRAPRRRLAEVAHEHLIKPERIGAVRLDQFIRVHHVAARLGHLLAVFAQDHALRRAPGVRLGGRDDADVVQELMPEARIKQVQGGVFHAAVVPVHRQPVVQLFARRRLGVVVRIDVTQEVPTRTGPLRHRVRLAPGLAAARRALRIHPIREQRQRRFARVCRLVAFDFGQHQRQLVFGDGHPAARLAMDQRDRLAPIALAAEDPVAQPIVHGGAAQASLFEMPDDRGSRFFDTHAVQEIRVDDRARFNRRERFVLDVSPGDDFDNRQPEAPGEAPVALVVSGHRHDRTGAIGNQDVVRQPDRDLLLVGRVHGGHALERDAGNFLRQVRAFDLALVRGGVYVGADFVGVRDAVHQFPNKRVLRRQDHIRRAEDRIGPGRVDFDRLVPPGDGKGDLRAVALADPVDLLRLDLFEKVDLIEVIDQALSVRGDLEHPLRAHALDDLAAAAFADAAHDFLIRQAHLALRAPVDRNFGLVGQALVKKLQKDPLRPFVVAWIRGIDLARPIKRKPQALELAPEVLDVARGDALRVFARLQRVVFGRQSEGVPADGIQHVEAGHAPLAGDDVHRGVAAGVADVQAVARRVRELNQRVELGQRRVVQGAKRLGFLPPLLPFGFDGLEIIQTMFAHDSHLVPH